MEVPEGLRYSPEHEWVRVEADGDGFSGGPSGAEGPLLRIGITDYAQDALGDVVYVELPEVGRVAAAGESLSEVESTKAVSEIFAPVSGIVIASNEALVDAPDLLNRDPYGEGWIYVLQLTSTSELEELLDAAAYRSMIEG